MPRRRASKGRKGTSLAARSRERKDSSIQRWNSRGDIPLDEVDQFHEQRDRILLQGDEATDGSDDGEEEVFALKGLGDSSDEIEDEGDEDENGAMDGTEIMTSHKLKNKTSKILKRPPQSSSDDEEGGEEEESWGTKRRVFYSSNAARLDSDDDEGHEMEEQEARRLQAKLREPLREDDFGFTEALQASFNLKDTDESWRIPDTKPVNADATDRISRLRLLQKTSPEALALAQEWEDVARSVMRTERELAQLDPLDPAVAPTIGLAHLHHQTQTTYAALLAFYLHLRASEKYSAKPELLRQHPILKRLLILKQSLTTFEDLIFNLSDSETDFEDDDLTNDFDDNYDETVDRAFLANKESQTWLTARRHGLDFGELEKLLANSVAPIKKANLGKHIEQPPEKKRKVAETQSKVVFDVDEPVFSKSSSKSTRTVDAFDGYGEATSLDLVDVADKGVQRKALRFHTAKIESASARRQGARNAMGGDDDIPYRGRKKEKTEKQVRKDLGGGGDDLDDADPEQAEHGRKRGRDNGNDENGSGSEDDDGYYSLIKKQKVANKIEKKAEYEGMKAANRIDFDDDTVDGQRGVTLAILKNKGLTPKRSKSVRNPRVKKRQKFEKAKKKLASQKAIYKGGIGDGHYDGEKSGISKVVKSIKM